MNKLKWATILLAMAALLLAFVGCLAGSSAGLAKDENLYGSRSREIAREYYVFYAPESETDEDALTAYFELDAAEQNEYARQTAAFMASPDGDAAFAPTIVRDGETISLYNERETLHMTDVHRLILLADGVSRFGVYAAAALTVAAAWTGLELKRRRRAVLCGAGLALGILAVIGLCVFLAVKNGGFSELFYGFHKLLFSNDLWLMDPQTDRLIRMMPQPLFAWAAGEAAKKATMTFGIVTVLLAALWTIVDSILTRHVRTKREG